MSEEFQRLSEGFDFLEEAVSINSEPLTFQSVCDLSISEASQIQSQYRLLGKVRGVMAPIGEFSRNGRLYENSHWNVVLSNPQLQDKIQSRRCFGTISHADKRIDDADFREGKISHIVSCLEVREDDSGKPFLYGEIDILDTPAGRILEAMYKGGAGLFVSTRGAGKLVDVPGQNYKLVSSSNYYFESIDFVLNPGFLQARPTFEAVDTEPKVTPNIQESAPLTQSADPALAESVEQIQPEQTQANEDLSHLSSQVDKLARILEKVVNDVYETEEQPVEEATNMEKVFDLDNKINNVEKIRKQEYEKTISAEGKPWTEVSKSQARVEQADNLLKRLKKSRKEALGESQASLISALALIKEANISEELMVDIVELIKKGLK